MSNEKITKKVPRIKKIKTKTSVPSDTPLTKSQILDLGPYVQIPLTVLQNEELTTRDVIVFGELASRLRPEQDLCWPPQKKIAQLLNCSVDTIQRSLDSLEYAGIIKREPRSDDRRRRAYRVLCRVEQGDQFAPLPRFALRAHDLSTGAKCLYASLLRYLNKNRSDTCYPSELTLALEHHVSDRTIRNWITKLCQAGLIRVKKRNPQGTQNAYEFLTPSADRYSLA